MDDVRKIAKQAGIALLERGGLALVPHAGASAFLRAVTEAQVRILAVDGFVMEDGELFTDQAAECDLTDLDDLAEVASQAEDFLEGFGPADDLYWDFVLDEE
jgi:hypothetical protein